MPRHWSDIAKLTAVLTGVYLAILAVSMEVSLVASILGGAKPVLPLICGGVAGYLYEFPRSTRIWGAGAYSLIQAIGWTSYSILANDLSLSKLPTLFAASLLVSLIGGLWAYFGMYAGRRLGESPPVSD